MIRFNCDYSEGAHERILRKLAETNLEQTPGYGEDHYCAEAAGIIRSLCGREDAAVHFLVGGTQANLTVSYCLLICVSPFPRRLCPPPSNPVFPRFWCARRRRPRG